MDVFVLPPLPPRPTPLVCCQIQKTKAWNFRLEFEFLFFKWICIFVCLKHLTIHSYSKKYLFPLKFKHYSVPCVLPDTCAEG